MIIFSYFHQKLFFILNLLRMSCFEVFFKIILKFFYEYEIKFIFYKSMYNYFYLNNHLIIFIFLKIFNFMNDLIFFS